ncbi:MAG TPA: cytochrome b N-terminal domain-containing protein, partial [Chloroflexota bacterium]|nr:cytochrome b N-terminal domain-containing protein [Chloroflexota bacterium]
MTATTGPGQRKESIPERLWSWIDERSGISSVWNVFFARKIPTGVGFLYTLGFATMFLFTVQAITGMFLAMYYSPSPDHAYDSVNFITSEVPLGAVIRGIHHWGASAMVVAVVLHMCTVFTLGAYKYPRELTWMVGVLLLVVTLGFAFTGYLLPWDEKAYWATVVGTNIPGTLPVIGDYILRILRGGSQLGVLTLTRFFSIHVLILPATLLGLVGAHLFLVFYHGVSVPPGLWERVPQRRGRQAASPTLRSLTSEGGDYHQRYEFFKTRGDPFWPNVIMEDMIVAVAALVIVLGLMVWQGVPLEARADPANTAYVPRPDWYFVFLFQLLKYFPGNL